MRQKYGIGIVVLCCMGLVASAAAPVLALDAYFDSQITTDLEARPDIGTVRVRILDEAVQPVFTDVIYEKVIHAEIIFDASKTMAEPDVNGIPKIEIAKRIVSLLVKFFPAQDTRFALRVNGARYANNCLDSELVVPFQRNNGAEVLEAVRTIQPTGLSPLTFSLRQVLQDFVGTKGTKLVFLITDGLETCDTEPADTCTVTMDMLQQAEFDGAVNIIGINTVYDQARTLLACLAARGNGEFLDSNRDDGRTFARLIRDSSQLSYSISKIIDPESLAEGKILELINRRIGDYTILEEDNVVLQPERLSGYSLHELQPGIYKIEFATVPVLASYFTLDRQQELTIGVVRSGKGLDLYDRAHLALGNWYYDNGQIEGAVEEYHKILEFDDHNVDAHLNLGIIYDDLLNDNEKAAEHYKQYLELQGPRQDEVREWLREVRGEPSEEELRQQRMQEAEQERLLAEQERLEAEERRQRELARQQFTAVYEEIRTANPNIRQLSEEEVRSADTVRVEVSNTTTDARAQRIAEDVARRIRDGLNRTPEIVVYRQNKPDVPVARATYNGETIPETD
jgi:tetratricopeptide (TPR) repeat protein